MDKFIFTNESKRKEWEDLDPAVKRDVTERLHKTCDTMGTKLSIHLLCNLFIDLQERIDKLEKESTEN